MILHHGVSSITTVLMVAVAGCSGSATRGLVGRNLWRDHGIRNYSMTVQRGGAWYTSPVHIVTVRNDRVTSVVDAEGTETPREKWAREYFEVRTINEMFAFIDSLRSTGQYQVEASFDERYGYPDRLDFRWTGQPNISESKSEFEVLDFEPTE
jgi:hypothetical protein